MRKFGMVGLLLVGSSHAMASDGSGLYAQLNFSPVLSSSRSASFTAGEDVKTRTNLGFDTRLTAAYALGGRFLVGASLNFSSIGASRDATATQDSLDASRTIFEVGPTVGYLHGGLHATATALFLGSDTDSAKSADLGGTPSFNDKSVRALGFGLQLNVGYTFSLTPELSLGPSLVWLMETYKNETFTDAITPANNTKDKEFTSKPSTTALTPMITLVYRMGSGGEAAKAQ
jgi:hypothetical protein